MRLDGRSAWPNITMLLVCLSFVAANLGYAPAQEMWADGAAAIAVFMGVGIGIRPAWKATNRLIEAKYNRRDISTGPEEP